MREPLHKQTIPTLGKKVYAVYEPEVGFCVNQSLQLSDEGRELYWSIDIDRRNINLKDSLILQFF